MKAISNILLTVLVVMIAISLALLAYIFFYRTFATTANAQEIPINTTLSKMSTGLEIEAASGKTVYLRNTGTSDLKNFLVYVNGNPVSFNINPSVLPPQGIATITLSDCTPQSDVDINVVGPGVEAYHLAHNMASCGAMVPLTFYIFNSPPNNTAVNTGTLISFGAQWSDSLALSMYVNSSSINGGGWTNGTWQTFAPDNWSNFTVTFPSLVNSNLTVKIYANDTSSNQSVTGTWFWYNTTVSPCDYFIHQSDMTNTYSISQSNKLYCLAENVYIGGKDAIDFASGIQNTALDCRGYNINGNGSYVWGIYLTGSGTKSNTIKNCNITNFGEGIYLDSGSGNNLITNNTFSNDINGPLCGIHLVSSINNTIINNVFFKNFDAIELESSSSDNVIANNIVNNNDNLGITLWNSCNRNNITNNTFNNNSEGIQLHVACNDNVIANNTANSNKPNPLGGFGIDMDSGSDNNTITGGSVANNIYYDYNLLSPGSNNNFINTNFTAIRRIYFSDATTWFNYNNETTGNIWLKTNVSAQANISRKLIGWSNTLMQWNDTSNATITARYNITGLLTNTNYNVYNNTVAIPGSPFNSSSSGQISFTINLPANKELNINVSSTLVGFCGDDVLCLKFNEANGTKVYDSSAYHNDGTFYSAYNNSGTFFIEKFSDGISYSGSTPTDLHTSSGMYGKALSFDGVNDYVNVNNLNVNGTFTVGTWAKVLDSNARTVVGSRAPSEYGFDFKFQNGNQIHGDIGNGTSWITTTADASINYQLNAWYHIVYVVTPTNFAIYINGSQVASNSYSTNVPVLSDANHRLEIGYSGVGSEYFNGAIDEVRIWNRSLSQAEIQADMSSSMPVSNTSFDESRPVASYSFEEPSGATYVNDTHIWVDGVYGSALSFNALSDYVFVPNSALLNPKNITLAAWINPGKTAECQMIISKGADYYDLYVGGGTGSLTFAFRNSTTLLWVTSDLAVTWNAWQFVALTYNGTHTVFYLNGTSNVKASNYGNMNTGDTEPVCIGCEPYWVSQNQTSPYFFNGTIDEPRIWNRVLSPSEIQTEMNKG